MSEAIMFKEALRSDEFRLDSKEAIIALLYETITAELMKGDEADCDTVAACAEAIAMIEQGESGTIVAFPLPKRIENATAFARQFSRKNTHAKVVAAVCASAACVILIGAVFTAKSDSESAVKMRETLSSFYEELFQTKNGNKAVNDSTAPAETAPATLPTEQGTVTASSAEEPKSRDTTAAVTEKPRAAALVTIFVKPGEQYKKEFDSFEAITYDGVKVYASFDDGSEELLDKRECGFSKGSPDADGNVKITVAYHKKQTCYYVHIKKQAKVLLTSIYGDFDSDWSLSSMKVFGTFSDGTTKEIPLSDCKVTTQPDSETNGIWITVEYGGCSFTALGRK